MKRLLNKAAIVFRLAAYDFKAAYAGSVFGSLWSIAEPLVTVAVYWFVYTIAFGGGSVNDTPYYLWLSVGIAPWFFISTGLRVGTSAYRDYSYLVKKMYFDKSVLPAVRTLSALFGHMVFMAVIIIMCIAEGVYPNIAELFAGIFIALMFIYFLSKILSLLCCICKDTQNIMAVLLNIGFWLTPVFWQVSVLDDKIARFVMLNPIAVIVEIYRKAILGVGIIVIKDVLGIVMMCVALFVISIIMEKRVLPDIADRL